MRAYRANVDQEGTNIVLGIFIAETDDDAAAAVQKLLWPGATLTNVFECTDDRPCGYRAVYQLSFPL